jgi:apolipoprotein N-acyltransferase
MARSTLGARQVVPAVLERRVGLTWYVRFGDIPVLVAALAALAAGWWIAVRRARRSYS